MIFIGEPVPHPDRRPGHASPDHALALKLLVNPLGVESLGSPRILDR
jgi:hypothetical protein